MRQFFGAESFFKVAIVIWILFVLVADCAAMEVKPKLQLQSGHNIWLNSIIFTSDDRQLVSSDAYGVIKFWEIASGGTTLTVKID